MKSIQPSIYTLPTLAAAWNCDVDQLELMASFAELEVISVQLGGRVVRGVTKEEKARVERARVKEESKYNPTQRETHLHLIAMLLLFWNGEVDFLDKPYAVASELEQTAASWGIPVLRGKDTHADVVREARALLSAKGWRPDGENRAAA